MAKINNTNVVSYNQSWIEAEKRKELRNSNFNQISKIQSRKRNFKNSKNSSFRKKRKIEVDGNFYELQKDDGSLSKEIMILSNLGDAKTSNYRLDLTIEDSRSNCENSRKILQEKENSQNSFNEESELRNLTNGSNNSDESYSKLKRVSRIYSDCSNVENYSIKVANHSYDLNTIKKLTVYIQMELCRETLGDYIYYLQRDLSKETSCYLLKMYSEIIRSVNYLHEKERIIHRDLKPSNIFLSHENLVKIGDFGLATEIFDNKYKKFSFCESDYDTSTRKNSDNSIASQSVYNEFLSSKHSQISYHTKNVGTLQYASPEQMNNHFYDHKCDIYSLGLILFEMLHPIKTGMEKHQTFSDLKKKGKVPECFSIKYPHISSVIVKMIDSNPLKRPEIKDVLDYVEEEIKHLCH